MNHHELDELLDAFSTISRMKTAVYDCHFHYLAGSSAPICDFCTALHKSRQGLNACLQSDLDALHKVEASRQAYVYTCPFGLFEAIVPVISKGELLAYLFIGPALNMDRSSDEIPMTAAQALQESVEISRQMIRTLPHYSDQELQAFCRTLEIFSHYLSCRELLPASRQSIGQLVKAYICSNLQKKITLAEISMNLHCSTVTLTENFRKEFGYTIMQYVTHKRMVLAETLLRESDDTVTEISERCGFSDVEYFSKNFKSCHGISPSVWRKENRT